MATGARRGRLGVTAQAAHGCARRGTNACGSLSAPPNDATARTNVRNVEAASESHVPHIAMDSRGNCARSLSRFHRVFPRIPSSLQVPHSARERRTRRHAGRRLRDITCDRPELFQRGFEIGGVTTTKFDRTAAAAVSHLLSFPPTTDANRKSNPTAHPKHRMP